MIVRRWSDTDIMRTTWTAVAKPAVDEQLEEVIWPEHRRPPDSKGVA
jgi:hypothetical protein